MIKEEKIISFIIIGKNEGWKLTQCLKSIYYAIKKSSLRNFEVIYVDSKSSDDSLSRAKEFHDLKIFQIMGKCNAAIARNIGAKESKGNLLFFLDGDMELYPNFVEEAQRLHKINYKFISGQIKEYFYDNSWNLKGESVVFADNKLNTFNLTNGGAFVIDKSLWQKVNGMRTKYVRSQDIDLNYRLIRLGYPVYRSKISYIKHHTIQYSYSLSWKREYLNFRNYLYKGLLIRDHFFNHKIIKRNIRVNYSLIILLFSIFFSVYLKSVIFFAPYFLLVLLKAINNYKRYKKVIKSNFTKIFIKYLYLDIAAIIGIFLFYPRNKPEVYQEIV